MKGRSGEQRVLLVKLTKPAGGPQRLSFSEPIGLCYIAAVLREAGVDCRLCHVIKAAADTDLHEAVRDYRPTVIGFSVRNFNFDRSARSIKSLRSQYPGMRFAIGGECITLSNARDLLIASGADAAFVGDSEYTFLRWIRGVSSGQLCGHAFRGKDNRIHVSPTQGRRANPARLPMMMRNGLPMSAYSAESFAGLRYATMHAQRGCRYRCTFCHTAQRYPGPLSRTVDQIFEEIDHLIASYGIQSLAIWDEDFFSSVGRAKRIAGGLIERGSPLKWHTFMKLTDLKTKPVQALLPTLRRAGYIRAIVGLESFVPATLHRYHKAGGPNIEESLQRLTDNDICLCPSYIIGEPHETYDDVRYGLDHLLRLRQRGIRMDFPYVAFITPFPGTPLYDEYVRDGMILDQNWEHFDGEHVIVRCNCPPDKLQKARDDFFREFYG